MDFLMPQFYNGVTRPMTDGVGGTGAGAMSAALLFTSLANDLFAQEPNKVSFNIKPTIFNFSNHCNHFLFSVSSIETIELV